MCIKCNTTISPSQLFHHRFPQGCGEDWDSVWDCEAATLLPPSSPTLTWSCISWGWCLKGQRALRHWWTSVCWGCTSSHRSLRSPSEPEQRSRAARTGGKGALPREVRSPLGHHGQSPPSLAHYAGKCRWCGWSPSCWRKTGPLVDKWHKHMIGKVEKLQVQNTSQHPKGKNLNCWTQWAFIYHVLWLLWFGFKYLVIHNFTVN